MVPLPPSSPAALSAAEVALCRATLYAALALGFRPPTTETVQRLTTAEAVAALTDAARMLDGCMVLTNGPSLGIHVGALGSPAADLEALTGAHGRLFGHTVRGEVPPYETEYGEEALFQQPQQLGDLAGFMRAFGLTLRHETHERLDHVSCECEFLFFLACKEAYAIDQGDMEMWRATERATLLFLRDHLGRFTPAFARQLAASNANGFYAALGQLLLALVTADGRRLGVETGPAGLGLRPDPALCAVPLGCGDGAEDGGCGALVRPS